MLSNNWIAGLVIGGIVIAIGYTFRSSPQTAAMYCVLALLLSVGSYFIFQGVTGDSSSSGNLLPSPVTSSTTIPAAKTPPQQGDKGGNYGIQFWTFIKDWDYKFGEKKMVLERGESVVNPRVYLSQTENTLCVDISVYSHSEQASEPAPVDSQGAGDIFTCKIPNVPLQKWFAVALSVSGRNLDVYLDGLLVKSCLLNGVPRNTGNSPIIVMPDGGFSGSVIDLTHFSRSLVPQDAQTYFSKGTNGTSYNSLPSKPYFGYNVNLDILDSSGKEVKKITF